MPRKKIVDVVLMDLTEEEEAELAAMAEAHDLDLSSIRHQRNGSLAASDWTQIGDATLGDHTAEEWLTYRQALRDYPGQSDRLSTLPAWPEDPPTAKATRKVVAGEDARQASLSSGGTEEEAQIAYDTAYAATD